jgi:hypothetical protein
MQYRSQENNCRRDSNNKNRLNTGEMVLFFPQVAASDRGVVNMSTIDDIRKVLQDVVTPDLKAIEARLTALEARVDQNHSDQMAAIRQVTDYAGVVERLAKLEAKSAA